MTTITAAVAREPHAPLSLEELELDEIRDNEVRVRMVATGICHTDAVVRDGLAPTPLHRGRRGGGQLGHHCPSR
jgi:aryl-alcohol dehydrogenase